MNRRDLSERCTMPTNLNDHENNLPPFLPLALASAGVANANANARTDAPPPTRKSKRDTTPKKSWNENDVFLKKEKSGSGLPRINQDGGVPPPMKMNPKIPKNSTAKTLAPEHEPEGPPKSNQHGNVLTTPNTDPKISAQAITRKKNPASAPTGTGVPQMPPQ